MRAKTAFLALAFLCLGASASGPEDQFFDSNGVQIRYLVQGTGEPVVLLHGITRTIEHDWVHSGVIRSLSRDFQVIALDQRGHGRSGKPAHPADYGIEMVHDVVRLLDHLGLRKAHLVGYSMGGRIALKCLAEYPGRVRTVTLAGSAGQFTGADIGLIDRLARDLRAGRGIEVLLKAIAPKDAPFSEDQLKTLSAEAMRRNERAALAAVAEGYRGFDVEAAALEQNQVPVLAVAGSADPACRGVRQLAGRVPGLKAVVLDGADHITVLGRPEFTKELTRFLADHRAR